MIDNKTNGVIDFDAKRKSFRAPRLFQDRKFLMVKMLK
jgi:hypothetical protein